MNDDNRVFTFPEASLTEEFRKEEIVRRVEKLNWYQLWANIWVSNTMCFDRLTTLPYLTYALLQTMAEFKPINVILLPQQPANDITVVNFINDYPDITVIECSELNENGIAYHFAKHQLDIGVPPSTARLHTYTSPLYLVGYRHSIGHIDKIVCGVY